MNNQRGKRMTGKTSYYSTLLGIKLITKLKPNNLLVSNDVSGSFFGYQFTWGNSGLVAIFKV